MRLTLSNLDLTNVKDIMTHAIDNINVDANPTDHST